MQELVGIKLSNFGQVYPYLTGELEYNVNEYVVCEFENAQKLAKIAWKKEVPSNLAEEYPDIKTIQKITPNFQVTLGKNQELTTHSYKFCKEKAKERGLDMKLVDVDFFYDNSKVVFYFTAPNRIDFRELVKDLVKELHIRIELRQIGVRHETQMVGALGNCGQTVCCKSYLSNFAPVTIKMAKEQNLFLNPAKISGICGRLLCCLSFEQENYDNFQKICPKLGKRYQTDEGSLRVVRTNMFRNSIVVLPEEGLEKEIELSEWQKLHPKRNEAPAPASEVKEFIDYSASFQVIMADPDSIDELDKLEDLE